LSAGAPRPAGNSLNPGGQPAQVGLGSSSPPAERLPTRLVSPELAAVASSPQHRHPHRPCPPRAQSTGATSGPHPGHERPDRSGQQRSPPARHLARSAATLPTSRRSAPPASAPVAPTNNPLTSGDAAESFLRTAAEAYRARPGAAQGANGAAGPSGLDLYGVPPRGRLVPSDQRVRLSGDDGDEQLYGSPSRNRPRELSAGGRQRVQNWCSEVRDLACSQSRPNRSEEDAPRRAMTLTKA
jgi:hypothetical protein